MSKKSLALAVAALLASSSLAYAQSTVPISQLPSASTPLAGSEMVPCVQGGVTKSCTTLSLTQAGGAGSYLSTTTTNVAMTSGADSNCGTITLGPGDWDVEGSIQFTSSTSNIITGTFASISSTSMTLGGLGAVYNTQYGTGVGLNLYQGTPTVRENLAATTTLYLVGISSFASGTVSCSGLIRARLLP